MQQFLFNNHIDTPINRNCYRPVLTVIENGKGVLDVDTVKGCTEGMRAYPNGGCYGECYAYKAANRYGIDFSKSVSRKLLPSRAALIFHTIKKHSAAWYRVGVAGDPCHDWENTISVCEALRYSGKIPVIVSKHWITLSDDQIERFRALSAVFNTSTSGLDTDTEIQYRVKQVGRLRAAGIRSVCRVVTCKFGTSEWAKACKEKQDYLLSLAPIIDTPLRANGQNEHVINGDIIIIRGI